MNLVQVDLDELDAYARKRENARRRADYAKHPERAVRQRMSSYTNFLRRNGKLVMDRPPEPPWSELQQRAILRAVESSFREGGDADA